MSITPPPIKIHLYSTYIAIFRLDPAGTTKNTFKPSSMCKSASQPVLSMMQLIPHATRRTRHGTPHLMEVMSAGSVKTRSASSWQRKDARVYVHTTTAAMHDIEYTPHA